MANRAYLVACPTLEDADRWIRGERSPKQYVVVGPKYHLPALWAAAFEHDDRSVVTHDGEASHVVLRTSGEAAAKRLQRRRSAIQAGLEHRFDALYDAWIDFVGTQFPGLILLDPQEIFAMTSFADAEAAQHDLLRALEQAEQEEPGPELAQRLSFELDMVESVAGADAEAMKDRYLWLGGYDGRGWPPAPEPAAKAESQPLDARLAELAVERLRRAYAEAVPRDALDELWLSGLFDETYTLARWRGPVELAWYAGLDPEPGSERVRRASETALRHCVDEEWVEVVACIPLTNEHVRAVAVDVCKDSCEHALPFAQEAQEILALRLDESRRVELTGLLGSVDAVLAALMAERTGDPAWMDKVLADQSDAAQLGFLRVARRTGRWPDVTFTAPHVLLGAMLRARRDGPDELQRMVDGLGEQAEPYARRLLDPSPPVELEQLESPYEEGLIDRWDLELGTARQQYERADAVMHAVARVLSKSRVASEFADELRRAVDQQPGDPGVAAEARSELLELADRGPKSPVLRRMTKPVARLAASANADELAEVVREIEQRWGPVHTWSRDPGFRSRPAIFQLVAGARGYARAAADLWAAVTRGFHLEVSRTYVVAGLIREGDAAEAEAGLRALLEPGRRPESEALPALVSALFTLDPEQGRDVVERVTRAVQALPASPDEVLSWLRA